MTYIHQLYKAWWNVHLHFSHVCPKPILRSLNPPLQPFTTYWTLNFIEKWCLNMDAFLIFCEYNISKFALVFVFCKCANAITSQALNKKVQFGGGGGMSWQNWLSLDALSKTFWSVRILTECSKCVQFQLAYLRLNIQDKGNKYSWNYLFYLSVSSSRLEHHS